MSKSRSNNQTANQHVKSILRATSKHYSAKEKIRIVVEGLRENYSIDGTHTKTNTGKDSIFSAFQAIIRPPPVV